MERLCWRMLPLTAAVTVLLLVIVVGSSDAPSPQLGFGSLPTEFSVDDKLLFNLQWAGSLSRPRNADELREKNLESVIIATARKEKYECYVPIVTKASEDEKEKDNYRIVNPYSMLKKFFEDSNFTPCSYRLEHYWTYELCHGHYMRQYHEDKENAKKPKLQEYVLGKYDKEGLELAEKEFEANPNSFVVPTKKYEGKDFPYLMINMTGGTLCDLNSMPRRTRVLYICHTDGRNDLYSFIETSTCEYEVVVLSAELCRHPLYRMKSAKQHNIQCYAFENSPKVPKSLSVIDVESAKLRLSSYKPKLKMGVDENSNPDEAEDDPDEPVVQLNKRPPPPATETASKVRVPSSPPVDTKLIKDFLSGDFCLVGGTSWWRYRFCLGKKVEQFHKEKGSRRETVILLGKWNSQKNKEWLLTKKQKSKYTLREKHSLYTDGDMCDAIRARRQVEVRLKCKEDMGHVSSVTMSLLEPTICKYILQVESPIVCSISNQDRNEEPQS